MILEVAVLNVRTGEEVAFEAAMRKARPLIEATPGFISINLSRCVETPNRYLLCGHFLAPMRRTSPRLELWRRA